MNELIKKRSRLGICIAISLLIICSMVSYLYPMIFSNYVSGAVLLTIVVSTVLWLVIVEKISVFVFIVASALFNPIIGYLATFFQVNMINGILLYALFTCIFYSALAFVPLILELDSKVTNKVRVIFENNRKMLIYVVISILIIDIFLIISN